MVEERIDSSFSSVDQIHYALGQSSLVEQFVDVVHGERDTLGRLDDERISGSDGVRQIPERDHAGKVEGHDGGDDAERLADHHLVDAAGNIFEVVALHHHGDAAGYFDVLDGAAHLGFGFGERLAVFLGEDAADVIEMIFEQHLELEERLDAVFRRSAAPFGESGGRGFNGGIHFAGVGEGDLGQRFAGRGIDDVAPFTGARVGPLTVDVIGEPCDGRSCYCHGNASVVAKDALIITECVPVFQSPLRNVFSLLAEPPLQWRAIIERPYRAKPSCARPDSRGRPSPSRPH